MQALGVLLFILASAALPARGQDSVTLAWDANPECNIAGYKVYYGTVSGQFTQVQDVSGTTTTLLSGLMPETTYYCAVQAYNADGLASNLSAEISFSILSAAHRFNLWAAAGGLDPSAADPTAMPFRDGVPNLLKFAFNLSAEGPDMRVLSKDSDTAGLPSITLDRSGSQPCLKVEFLRRKASGLIYLPKFSSDLVTYEIMTGTPEVQAVNDEWERVSLLHPCDMSNASCLFARVEVTLP